MLEPIDDTALQALSEETPEELRAVVDEERKNVYLNALNEKTPVRCHPRGCTGCCYQDPEVLDTEIPAILRRVRSLADRKQSRIGAAAKNWKDGHPCPLLNVTLGYCYAYEDRPLYCRSRFSVDKTAPEKCGESAVPLYNHVWVVLAPIFRSAGRLSRLTQHLRE